MSTPPKVFRAEPKKCVTCEQMFYPAFPTTVACCMECWRDYKLTLHRGYDGSTKTGPSSRSLPSRRKYATTEEAKEAGRKRARERWQRLKHEEPERYREINRNHSKIYYKKHRDKVLEKSRRRATKRLESHAKLKALSELRTISLLGENHNE